MGSLTCGVFIRMRSGPCANAASQCAGRLCRHSGGADLHPGMLRTRRACEALRRQSSGGINAAWTVVDAHHSIIRTPTVAVVFALVLIPFTFFLSLLLLLIKQDRTWYEAQVTVFGPGFTHVSRIPVKDSTGLAQIHARVGYARSLAAAH